ncbi:hypothetical protein MCERHM32_00646 [Methylophilaceae bacterium]|jgi:hypothetical protein
MAIRWITDNRIHVIHGNPIGLLSTIEDSYINIKNKFMLGAVQRPFLLRFGNATGL